MASIIELTIPFENYCGFLSCTDNRLHMQCVVMTQHYTLRVHAHTSASPLVRMYM